MPADKPTELSRVKLKTLTPNPWICRNIEVWMRQCMHICVDPGPVVIRWRKGTPHNLLGFRDHKIRRWDCPNRCESRRVALQHYCQGECRDSGRPGIFAGFVGLGPRGPVPWVSGGPGSIYLCLVTNHRIWINNFHWNKDDKKYWLVCRIHLSK